MEALPLNGGWNWVIKVHSIPPLSMKCWKNNALKTCPLEEILLPFLLACSSSELHILPLKSTPSTLHNLITTSQPLTQLTILIQTQPWAAVSQDKEQLWKQKIKQKTPHAGKKFNQNLWFFLFCVDGGWFEFIPLQNQKQFSGQRKAC